METLLIPLPLGKSFQKSLSTGMINRQSEKGHGNQVTGEMSPHTSGLDSKQTKDGSW